jgi:hypothetical protein
MPGVAQIFNLLYRRTAFGKPRKHLNPAWIGGAARRLKTCDTAD